MPVLEGSRLHPGLCPACPETPLPTGRSQGSRKQTAVQPGAGARSQAGDRLPLPQGHGLRTQKPPAWAVCGLLAALVFSWGSRGVSGDHFPLSSPSPGVGGCLGLSQVPHTCARDPTALGCSPPSGPGAPILPKVTVSLSVLAPGETRP